MQETMDRVSFKYFRPFFAHCPPRVCSIDNSEAMRNGDYLPTRFDGQADAVNLLANAKTSQNPESTVGLISMAGKRVEVLQTLVQDPTDVLTAMHSVRMGGEADLSAGLETAQLALKHRANKNGGQRIVVFLGSQFSEDAKALVRVGKKLKKSGIDVDIVTMGDELENDERIKALMEAVDKGGASHLVHVPAGVGMIADVLLSSTIFYPDSGAGGEEGATGGGASGSGGGEGRPMMGVDPNVDPELYEAIQMSLREQQQREADAAAVTDAGAANGAPATPANSLPPAATPGAPPPNAAGRSAVAAPADDDMDEEMRAAIALSLQMEQAEDETVPASVAPSSSAATVVAEDPDVAAALAMSRALTQQSDQEAEVMTALQDADYVKSLFGDLPVDLDDASIQEALQSITKGSGTDEGKESDPKKKKKDEGDSK